MYRVVKKSTVEEEHCSPIPCTPAEWNLKPVPCRTTFLCVLQLSVSLANISCIFASLNLTGWIEWRWENKETHILGKATFFQYYLLNTTILNRKKLAFTLHWSLQPLPDTWDMSWSQTALSIRPVSVSSLLHYFLGRLNVSWFNSHSCQAPH